jgi:predicted nucleic acid-binding protein
VIYLDSSALLKLVKPERETAALRAWRANLSPSVELVTSGLARAEISRKLHRAGAGHRLVPHATAEALKGVHTIVVDDVVLARAAAYPVQNLGTLDAIHLASAEPLRNQLTEFVTYDVELAAAATTLGLTVAAPR